MSENHKRKLSNYLLDRQLQLRYTAVVTVIAAIVSTSLGYLIWRQGQLATAGVEQSFANSPITEDDKTIMEDVLAEAADRDRKTVLVVTSFGKIGRAHV